MNILKCKYQQCQTLQKTVLVRIHTGENVPTQNITGMNRTSRNNIIHTTTVNWLCANNIPSFLDGVWLAHIRIELETSDSGSNMLLISSNKGKAMGNWSSREQSLWKIHIAVRSASSSLYCRCIPLALCSRWGSFWSGRWGSLWGGGGSVVENSLWNRFPVQTRAPPWWVTVEESLGKTLNP